MGSDPEDSRIVIPITASQELESAASVQPPVTSVSPELEAVSPNAFAGSVEELHAVPVEPTSPTTYSRAELTLQPEPSVDTTGVPELLIAPDAGTIDEGAHRGK